MTSSVNNNLNNPQNDPIPEAPNFVAPTTKYRASTVPYTKLHSKVTFPMAPVAKDSAVKKVITAVANFFKAIGYAVKYCALTLVGKRPLSAKSRKQKALNDLENKQNEKQKNLVLETPSQKSYELMINRKIEVENNTGFRGVAHNAITNASTLVSNAITRIGSIWNNLPPVFDKKDR